MINYLHDFLTGILFSVIIFITVTLLSDGGHTLGSLLFESIYPSGILGLLLFPIFELVVPLALYLVLIKTAWKDPLKKNYIRFVAFALGGYLVYVIGMIGFFVTISPDIL
ncbi:MAG: hypothetical protein A3B99_04430 [Candidatus Yanofskybacteria bacterium RIFCSPHIGHO2_02_FULL_44_12b]|uniref:Uncharacterized protein n=2 Tax=Candidatus Yanofskyibacteriota TaxID=1752733 RepID=A0A1F8GJR7_9BACT|nr:MAG: hypothetical protein UW79_C0014G0002 [Candidatus Yanofskybacteria bacterium GW2011_GWA2_44_9]OGN04574.1 MAG: hypothetical protein A2659_00410 [Candidatus Yanofskybacteria bacterium RIFCSPHIGHO2_01_FULL_44_24]OGN15760.1 MAG: hypothetical protein A3B99_04430 [Candidatus Yanofskybacteria bacterium RIFCSPHIGHO2_02_FULL_44_12b]OGN25645.1 MAG: hypothetical protein A2925_01825 [Candidatus Yanofskybacteria bacterium RIFCSPLOWO2_01_FULL_44_22]